MSMMHDIQLKIGTIFSGEGMKQCRNEVKTLNGQVKQAAGVANQLGGVIGGLDASYAKAVGSVTSLINVLTTGSVVMIGIQAAILAITTAIELFNKRAEEQKKKIEELKVVGDALRANFAAKFKNDFEEVIKTSEGVVAAFDSITGSAQKLQAATLALQNAQNNKTIAEIEYENFKKVVNAETDMMKKLYEADGKLAVAKEEQEQSIQAWNAKIDEARKHLEDSDTRVQLLEENRVVLMKELNEATKASAQAHHKNKDLLSLMQKAQEKVDKNYDEYSKALEESVLAQKNLEKTVVDAEAAAIKNKLSVEKLQEARDMLAFQEREAYEKGETRKINEKHKEELDEELLKQETTLKIITEESVNNRRRLAQAEQDYAEALRAYREKLITWQTRAAARNDELRDPTKSKERQEEAAKWNYVREFDNHFTVAADRKAMRDGAMMQIASDNSREAFRRNQEAKRYEDLKDRSDAVLTAEQKQFRDLYKQRVDREMEEENRRQEALQRIQEEQERANELRQLERESYTNIEDIKLKLDHLGLK